MYTGKYRHSAFWASGGDIVQVLQLQMAELLMLGNMVELHEEVKNVMVGDDLPVAKVITGGGDGVN